MIINLNAPGVIDDTKIQSIARALAMDIDPVGTIATANGVTMKQMLEIAKLPYFQKLLKAETEAWLATTSTAERVKYKSLSIIEQSLPEFYAMMHDKNLPLLHKTDTLKTIAKLAGLGQEAPNGGGEKFSVTINLGEQKIKIENVAPRPDDNIEYIEAEAAE